MRTAAGYAAFLDARLDEDEYYLRTMIEVGERGAAAATPSDLADVAAVGISVLSDPQVLPLLEHWTEAAVPVPNDLRRLLSEVEAKRAILRRCGVWMNEMDQYPNGLVSPRAVLARQTLMDLAAVYGDHPDAP